MSVWENGKHTDRKKKMRKKSKIKEWNMIIRYSDRKKRREGINMEETIGKTYHEHRRHQDITIANTACAIKKTNNFLFFNKFQYSYTNPGLKIPWCEHYLLYRTNTRNSFSSIIFRSASLYKNA